MRHPIRPFLVTAVLSVISAFVGCSGENYPSTAAGGAGASATGATSTGANAFGGAAGGGTGSTSTAGAPASAGVANAGVSGAIASGSAPHSGGTSITGGTSFGVGGASAASGGVFPVGGANGSVAGGNRSGSDAGGALGGESGITGQGGSPQAGASGGAVAVSFLEIENIIGNNCAACHIDQRPDLTTTGTALHSTLLSTVVKQCGNHKLVVPNDPTNSAVIELVTKKCNEFIMPTSCTDPVCLVPAEFAKLTSWISLGAKAQ
jgi:hypothetical protein